MHLFGRDKDLTLIAPGGLMDIITLQLKHSQTWLNYKINLTEWIPNEKERVFENKTLTIDTIPMDHGVPCAGFLFREKPKKRRINRQTFKDIELSPLDISRLKDGEDVLHPDGSIKYDNKLMTLEPHPQYSYAYCSDTRFNRRIIDQIKGVDILYHESTFADDMKERAQQTFHSTAKEAASIAKEACVGQLLLGHFSARYRELDPIINEALTVFPKAELALEGEKFGINGKG